VFYKKDSIYQRGVSRVRGVLLYAAKVKQKVTGIKKDRDNMPVPQKQ
jgi:hypothetical protein